MPEWPPPSRRSFSTLVTVVCSIVALLYIGFLGRPLVEPRVSPLAELERPAESLERLVTRELDLRAAMRGGPRWEWRLDRALSGDEDPLVAAGDWYGELVEQTDSPLAQLERAIILAETGHAIEARDAVAELAAGTGARAEMAAWARAAYLDPPPAAAAGHAAIAEIDDLPPTWFTDTLVRRIATRIGDSGPRARAEAAIIARGRALQRRARALIAISLALLGAGVVALVWMLARRRRARVADAPLPPRGRSPTATPSSCAASGAPQAIALVLFIALRRETGSRHRSLAMAADLPLFCWVILYLRRPGTTMRETFGLVPGRQGWAPPASARRSCSSPSALVGDALVDTVSRAVDLKTHWTDGFTEELLWARAAARPPRGDRRHGVGAHRGGGHVPRTPLRRRSGPESASRHGGARERRRVHAATRLRAGRLRLRARERPRCGPLAYERTRSLLPGLFAHAANNLLSTLWAVGLLR